MLQPRFNGYLIVFSPPLSTQNASLNIARTHEMPRIDDTNKDRRRGPKGLSPMRSPSPYTNARGRRRGTYAHSILFFSLSNMWLPLLLTLFHSFPLVSTLFLLLKDKYHSFSLFADLISHPLHSAIFNSVPLLPIPTHSFI